VDRETLLASCGPEGNARAFADMAIELKHDGVPVLAATAYDRAFGLDPTDKEINLARNRLLESLAVREHGLLFRHVPGGSFLMGSNDGDADERPVHPVELSGFWISDAPLSWAAYCRLMGWQQPPKACPVEPATRRESEESRRQMFMLHQANKIRLQYCEDRTMRARDWHAHDPEQIWTSSDGTNPRTARELFGPVDRDEDSRPWAYSEKPMVAVSWQEVDELCRRISCERVTYRLPTEAEWEKAARGGLIGAAYPWGIGHPEATFCDFNRFDQFSIQPSRRFSPNGYGLHAMSGGICEWVSDWYDSRFYLTSPRRNPKGPTSGDERILRGGSWADCASAVTVSFRASRKACHWRDGEWGHHMAPNIGFRLCRVSNEI